MRIFTSICCGVMLFPSIGFTSYANSTEEPLLEDLKNSVHTKSIFLDTHQWTTKAYLLQNTISQLPNESFNTIKSEALTESTQSRSPQEILSDLDNLSNYNFAPDRGSPGFTIANPYGFGADNGDMYAGLSYQTRTRYGDESDASMGIGFAVGSAVKTVALELNYTLASFGGSRDFGSGGFNAKLHRQLGSGWGVAAGWNGFLNIGDDNDFQDSVYFATTKIFRTRESLDSLFSRMAFTVGVGNGQYRTEDSIADDEDNFNVFGSLAFRLGKPASAIVEWTGQDLAVGTSLSPFKRLPVTFNLALRDITGAGDGARFVFGVGTGF